MLYASIMPPSQTTVTQLLKAVGDGDRTAFDELYDLLYEELRVRAHWHRQRWRGDYTLDTIALVGEAYEKLVDQTSFNLKSRAHFLAVAAKAMRFILLDYAKQAKIENRLQRVSLDKVEDLFEKGRSLSGQADVLVVLDEALKRLSQVDERQSQVAVCRFFGGMTIKETAEALGIATATVNRDWVVAKTWLYREIKRILDAERPRTAG